LEEITSSFPIQVLSSGERRRRRGERTKARNPPGSGNRSRTDMQRSDYRTFPGDAA
jgi:hypothetical protein